MKYELIRDSPNDFWISIHQGFYVQGTTYHKFLSFDATTKPGRHARTGAEAERR